MNTPETDKFWKQLGEQYHMSPYQFAAMLETERNEARKQRDELLDVLDRIIVHEKCHNREHAAVSTYAKQAIANVKGERGE